MRPIVFEALVDELSNIGWLNNLPSGYRARTATSSAICRNIGAPRWLRKAKVGITRRKIQERVDEIAEAHRAKSSLWSKL
jgi:hypothetical protein